MIATLIRSTVIVLGMSAFATASAADLTGKTVRVGSDIAYPPYEYYDAEKKPAGFDVSFLELLAEAGGFQLEWIDTRFENLIIGVSGNKFDVIASALYVNPDRAKQIAFIPYVKTGVSIGVLATGDFRPQTPEDLCGKRVGLIKGAGYKSKLDQVSSTICAAKGLTIDLREFPTSPEAAQAVLSGNVDAQTDDSAVLKGASEKTQGRMIISSSEQIYPQVVGLGLKKDNDDLKAGLEAAFDKVKAEGKFEALLKEYNIAPVSKEEADKSMQPN